MTVVTGVIVAVETRLVVSYVEETPDAEIEENVADPKTDTIVCDDGRFEVKRVTIDRDELRT